jgi:hypothetical protein
MRKPITVYVNGKTHGKLSAAVERVLDEHGTLSGFFSFLENSFDTFRNEPDTLGSEPEAWIEYSNFVKTLDWFQILADSGQISADNRKDYQMRWKSAAEKLPWHNKNPGASHLFSLSLLANRGSFDVYNATRSGTPPRMDIPGFSEYKRTEWEDYKQLREIGLNLPVKGLFFTHTPYPARRIDYKDRIEFESINTTESEPNRSQRDRAISLYLDSDQHEFFYNVFGKDIFRALETALWYELSLEYGYRIPEEDLDVSALSHFLEHGSELLDLEEAQWNLREVLRNLAFYWLKAEIDEIEDQAAQKEANLMFVGLKTSPNQLHLSDEEEKKTRIHGLPVILEDWDTYWDQTLIAVPSLQEMSSLQLAFRFGLLDLDTDGLERAKRELTGRVLTEYGLTRLGPDRPLLAAAIAKAVPQSQLSFPSHPIGFHIMELFKCYALSVLPATEATSRRVSKDMLATLADSEAFPTRSALERMSGETIRKTPLGIWQVIKSRRVVLELSNAEAYWVSGLFRNYPKSSEFETALQVLANIAVSREIPGKQTTRITIKLELEFLEHTLAFIRKYGVTNSKNPQTTAHGVAILLACELIEEAVGGDGQITAQAFLENERSWRVPLEYTLGAQIIEAEPAFFKSVLELGAK